MTRYIVTDKIHYWTTVWFFLKAHYSTKTLAVRLSSKKVLKTNIFITFGEAKGY